MGMVLYGMDNTRNITDQMMINHAKAVKKAAEKSLVFFDLPFQKKFDEKEMITRVKNIFKKTGCDGVKIEGNAELINVIQKLKKLNIPVMAHLGLQPQKFTSSKNFKIYGKNKKDLDKIIDDSIKLQNSGAVALLLEGMKTNIAKMFPSIGHCCRFLHRHKYACVKTQGLKYPHTHLNYEKHCYLSGGVSPL